MLELFPEGLEERDFYESTEFLGYGSLSHVSHVRDVVGAEGWVAAITPVPPGWEGAWKKFHRPVMIQDLWLGPPWVDPPQGVRSVKIAPGMAFGTGAHPTTRLCIELLLLENRVKLFDLGCGSGVLALAGAVLGFDPVSAFDIDDVAIQEAKSNTLLNNVSMNVTKVDVRELKFLNPPLITANLPLETLLQSLSSLRPLRAIISGFMIGKMPEIPAYCVQKKLQNDDWEAALIVRKEGLNSV